MAATKKKTTAQKKPAQKSQQPKREPSKGVNETGYTGGIYPPSVARDLARAQEKAEQKKKAEAEKETSS